MRGRVYPNLSCGHHPGRVSELKHRPANGVSQPLVVKNKVPNGVRELVALPLALESSGSLAFSRRHRSTHCLDGVGGRAEFVGSNMGHGCCLSRGKCGVTCGTSQLPRGCIGMTSGTAGFRHRDFAASPCTNQGDGGSWPGIVWSLRFKETKDVLGAGCGPQGNKPVMLISERSTATNGDEAGIANLRQDHRILWLPIESRVFGDGVLYLASATSLTGVPVCSQMWLLANAVDGRVRYCHTRR